MAEIPWNLLSNFLRNSKYAVQKASSADYITPLSAADQRKFNAWVVANKVPYDLNATIQDYDMQGYWKDVASKGGNATKRNANDNLMHFPDTYKTPYHQSFSAESRYALPNAPVWNNLDQLVDPKTGQVVFDERAH